MAPLRVGEIKKNYNSALLIKQQSSEFLLHTHSHTHRQFDNLFFVCCKFVPFLNFFYFFLRAKLFFTLFWSWPYFLQFMFEQTLFFLSRTIFMWVYVLWGYFEIGFAIPEPEILNEELNIKIPFIRISNNWISMFI